MTSNISFFSMVKSDLKRRIWVTALLFLSLFAALPLSGMMYIDGQASQLGSKYITLEQMIENLAHFAGPTNVGMYIIVIGGSVLTAFTGYAYLHSSRKLDLFHSLPVTREKLFFVQYVSGILVFALPYAVNLVLFLIVCIIKTVCTAAVLGSLAAGVILHFLYFLLFYQVAIIAILLTGRILVSLLGLGVIQGYAILFWQVTLGYCNAFFDTFYQSQSGLAEKIVQVFSPFYLYAFHTNAFSWKELQSMRVFAGQWKHLLLLLAEIILLLFAAVMLYRKRASEAAGRSMAFEKTKPVIKVMIMILFSAAGGLLFEGLAEDNSTGWLIFGVVFIALVLHCLIEVIYSYEFRQVLAHKATFFASLAVTLLGALAFCFDWFGYDTSLPQKDRLDSIAVYINDLEAGRYYDGEFIDPSEYAFENGRMTEVEAGYRLAQIGVRNEKDGLFEDSDWSGGDDATTVNAVVTYYMGGAKKTRSYTLTGEQMRQCLPALYDTDEFKKGQNTILGMDTGSVTFDYVNMFDAGHSGKINLSPENIEKLLAAYQQELLEASGEELQIDKICGGLWFGEEKGEENSSVTVYESFDQTLGLLEELGYPMKKVPDIKDVTQITVHNYNMAGYQENGEVYEDLNVVFEDPEDIKEILEKAVVSDAPYFEVEQDYMVTVVVNSKEGEKSNYMELSYSFALGEIPQCVLDAFQNR